MTGPAVLTLVVGLIAALVGLSLGWYLRGSTDWCPQCGEQLECNACGNRAAWPRTPRRLTSPH